MEVASESNVAIKKDYDTSASYMGCVKWFSSTKGFGYVTVKDGPLTEEDIFTHHSVINLEENKYKFLVPGEYVHIKVADCKKEGHLYQASQVKAPCENGKLMCEVRASKPRTRNFRNGEHNDE